MTAITEDQSTFASRMTERQWRVLQTLVMFWCPLTASERSDPELYILIRRKLAICRPSAQGITMWGATAAGIELLRTKQPERYYYATGER